ncbi:methyltransferase domain-containing protein [Aspergillus avenaceus]|uniref:Methyltransferase domain-containing protein n=1 Tax=Aspergillus avenaceus TaxID=36643 RepID=A0A5N6TU65_ASPAV|nr:methyltransferase domain-containing protein [Aspergillus avenaceus]
MMGPNSTIINFHLIHQTPITSVVTIVYINHRLQNLRPLLNFTNPTSTSSLLHYFLLLTSNMSAQTAVAQPTGRQYHSTSSPYVLPNDAVEQDRLDAQAAAIVEMIGGSPFLAPVRSMSGISKAVDVGCGTGVATVQLATIFPEAKVYGLDLSPVPDEVKKIAPANTRWATGNILEADDTRPAEDVMNREIFTPGGLDYIFGRMLFLGINNWQQYFLTAAKSLRSGGIIEHQDLDWKFYRAGTSDCLSDEWEWHRVVCGGAEHAGLSTRSGSGAAKFMEESGLEVLSVQTFEFSFVPSSKTPNSQAMGRYVQAKLMPNYPELLRKMLGAKGITGSELERLTKDCLRDLSSEPGVHQKYTVTIARKP